MFYKIRLFSEFENSKCGDRFGNSISPPRYAGLGKSPYLGVNE
jgi:hypothetical protein